ncbi:conserved protein of unknown function [Rhodovastum atsumiense]|uniref:Rhodanese domain-containing protein n=1 Tax=Rhodovastum atsumiense TaxID=504468 RepID=A0A5M6J380_9PROT|nr:rhodanese-like domain-containing protein [Rhodovastum atsumiense]KAA5614577.1 hypothetical protein F1189_00115 [Rhodovastum atsumiense]CAH2599930.1 conserved protein of unknown function [Rhodovastum atsumiense]
MTLITQPLATDSAAQSPAVLPATITPEELRRIALSGAEIAVVDVREGDAYINGGHISIAVELPLSELELKALALLPRRGITLAVTDDDGESLAPLAARRLAAIGYTDVRVLAGGLAGWVAAGFRLITGQHALSKALGEVIERRDHTPRITAEELRDRFAAGEEFVVFDTRPLDEFHFISLPEGIAAPGAELLHRVFDAVPSSQTPIVVNCAGRTRAIIGAQALINAGLPNPVVSLENGTAAWQLAGLAPVHGATREAARPSATGLTKAKEAQHRLAQRFGIVPLSPEQLTAFRNAADARTLYLYDIRTAGEFAAGHLPGSRHAAGGQLVQNTDRFIGTRQGRIVLIDDADLVRATITASWLLQLGLADVHVYPASPGELNETGPVDDPLPPLPAPAATIAPQALSRLLAGNHAVVIDLDPAEPYHRIRRHIPGARVGRRGTLAARLASLPDTIPVVLTSKDGRLAALAAADLHGATSRELLVLEGGTDGWIDAGLGFETGVDQLPLDPSEALPQPLTLDQRRAYFDSYVAWGHVIGEELAQDGLVQFPRFSP